MRTLFLQILICLALGQLEYILALHQTIVFVEFIRRGLRPRDLYGARGWGEGLKEGRWDTGDWKREPDGIRWRAASGTQDV